MLLETDAAEFRDQDLDSREQSKLARDPSSFSGLGLFLIIRVRPIDTDDNLNKYFLRTASSKAR